MSTVVQPSAGGAAPVLAANLEGCDPEIFAQRMGVVAEWQRMKALTAEIFPGPLKLQVVRDPELTDQFYIVMRVVCSGSVDEAVARQMDWMSRSIDAAGPQARFFHPSVDVV